MRQEVHAGVGGREERNCAWEAGTEARVPGGGVRGAQVDCLLLQGGRGLVGPGHQSAEAAQAVPQAPRALALRWSVLTTPSSRPQEDTTQHPSNRRERWMKDDA